MIIKAKDVPETEMEGAGDNTKATMKRIINREEHSENISITWVKIRGSHEKLKCEGSDRVYYIIDGEAEFKVGDNAGKVESGDHVLIPKGIPYEFNGEMTYIVINGPAYVKGSDIYLEQK